MTKICTVIAEKSKDEILQALKEVKGSDMVELRLDYLKEISEEIIEEILKEIKLQKIVTFRPKKDGGLFEGPEDVRIRYLQKAIECGADYVDIELSTDTGWRYELLKRANGKNCRAIVSFHDFEGTPDDQSLAVKIEDSYAAGGSIAKICTTAKSMNDALRILEIVAKYREKGKEIIGIAMGEEGKITRLPWKRLGNYLTYVSQKNPEHGQFKLDTALKLKEILDG